MSDFYQTGVVTTLHRLSADGLDRLEEELEEFTQALPVSLVLPALYSEFEAPAMRTIVSELRKVRYLREIVVALGRADDEQYRKARSFFDGFGVPVTFLSVNSDRVRGLFDLLDASGLSAGPDGKGRSCWLAYRLPAGATRLRCDRAARLRHRELRSAIAGAVVLSGRQSAPGLRILQGLLRPGYRSCTGA